MNTASAVPSASPQQQYHYQQQQQKEQKSQQSSKQNPQSQVLSVIQENSQQICNYISPSNALLNNPNINANDYSDLSIFKNSQLLSNNYQFQQQLGQIYILEQQCLHKCNEWLEQHNVIYHITKEIVKFSTMIELEVFVVSTRNKMKKTKINCFKWGTAFGGFLSQLFFYFNSDKSFTGEQVFRITGLSALAGGVFTLLLSHQQNISQMIMHNNVHIDFNAFELFFESCLQDIHRLRKKLVV